MSYSFSKSSKAKLATCVEPLQLLANEVIKEMDCTVIWGHRTKEEQNKLFAQVPKVTNAKFPQSKHNTYPSVAFDLAPYIAGKGIVWTDRQCAYFAGRVIQLSKELFKGKNYFLVCGADWDSDNDVHDHKLVDICHFELRYKK